MADQAAVKANTSVTNRLGAIPAGFGAGPSLTGNGNAPGPGDMVSNVAEFGENILSLAELQVRLADPGTEAGRTDGQGHAPR